ncbi:MAG: sensor histidine kinase [Planctomycetes bacterium]|nr:sensor histidine kinase [Planctomycetota bacterium]
MSRSSATWLVFVACLILAVAAMLWVSRSLIGLDDAQREAQQRAALEEAVRLALWRMDSAMGPLLAQEANRPYFTYRPFYTERLAFSAGLAELRPSEVRIASPLLTQRTPMVRVYFQIDPDGRVTSPQVPVGEMRAAADRAAVPAELIEESARRLALLEPSLHTAALARKLTPIDSDNSLTAVTVAPPPIPPESEQQLAQIEDDNQQGYAAKSMRQQKSQNLSEYQQRSKLSQNGQPSQIATPRPTPAQREETPDAAQGAMRPVPVGSSIILARRVRIDRREWVQGCELDWPAVQRWLLEGVGDVLPRASLALAADGAVDPSRMMASIPVVLAPGALPVDVAALVPVSTVRATLAAAWAALAVAVVAVGLLLAGVMRLSDRRAAFVSAVTHELRTPLTTFRLYTEMLAQGRVADEVQRRSYLDTLRGEAERLSHLVENVLAHARLERRRARVNIDPIPLQRILDRTTDRLARRAEQSGMTLAVEVSPQAAAAAVRADPVSVDQVLMNLVDNACKYAASATDRRIHLEVTLDAGRKMALLGVRDHGPGIPPRRARRLFNAFEKSASEAASTAPGIGLGLALSRRLARAMGGNLLHRPTGGGALFVLWLSLVTD